MSTTDFTIAVIVVVTGCAIIFLAALLGELSGRRAKPRPNFRVKDTLRIIVGIVFAAGLCLAPLVGLAFVDIGSLGTGIVLIGTVVWWLLLIDLSQRWQSQKNPNFGSPKSEETQGNQRQRQGGPEAPKAQPFRKRTWRTVLGFKEDENPSMRKVRSAYRRLAKSAHPDAGGTHAQMIKLNTALNEARKGSQEKDSN